MRVSTGVVWGTVGIVLVLTLASGPLVGAVDFTRRTDLSGLGTGNVTVDSVSAPSTVELEATFASDSYRLEVPETVVTVSSVTGRPIVAYRLDIPALNYARTTIHVLDESHEGRLGLSIEPTTFPPEEIRRDRYDGNLSVIARYNDTERLLYRDRVTVVVTE